MMDNQKNILIAGLACIALWLGFELWFSKPPKPLPKTEQVERVEAELPVIEREAALNLSPRIPIQTPTVQGSLSLRGARIDDLVLKAYHEAPNPQSLPVTLLSPKETAAGYWVTFSWYNSQAGVDLPTEDTEWQVVGQPHPLTPETPLTLQWTNPQGMRFQQEISIDSRYMFTIRQSVHNALDVPIAIGVQSTLSRRGPIKTSGYMAVHEGALGVFEGRLKEAGYKDMVKEGTAPLYDLGTGEKGVGWLGITDKYWLSSIVPGPEQPMRGGFRYLKGSDIYCADSEGALHSVAPGAQYVQQTSFFAGPKKVTLLDAYKSRYPIHNFDLAVDFGWFHFLTKPMFYLLSWLKEATGSFGWAIILMTILIKGLFFPLSLKSYRSMAGLKRMQPQLQAIKERFKDDKIRMNEELMKFYRQQNINPVSGCLPMLIQIPVFFALYKVLFISIEMRHAPFIGWVKDLSAADPTSLFNLFGLIPWELPSFLQIGLWPILMGLSMMLQQRMSGMPSPDPVQRNLLQFGMPLMFTYMLAHFPVGLIIYWTWSNLLTVLQQWVMTKYYGEGKRQ